MRLCGLIAFFNSTSTCRHQNLTQSATLLQLHVVQPNKTACSSEATHLRVMTQVIRPHLNGLGRILPVTDNVNRTRRIGLHVEFSSAYCCTTIKHGCMHALPPTSIIGKLSMYAVVYLKQLRQHSGCTQLSTSSLLHFLQDAAQQLDDLCNQHVFSGLRQADGLQGHTTYSYKDSVSADLCNSNWVILMWTHTGFELRHPFGLFSIANDDVWSGDCFWQHQQKCYRTRHAAGGCRER